MVCLPVLINTRHRLNFALHCRQRWFSRGERSDRPVPITVLFALMCALSLNGITPVARVHAQTVAEHLALGDRESAARHTTLALEHFELAVKQDPRNPIALWKASREAVDLGEVEANATRRTALYAKATEYARRAVELNPNDADAHFHLARALGRTALSMGVRDRVKYAESIRTHALRAIELSPRNAGALHVMGVWNAEIMRLGGFQRMFAKTFLGAGMFGTASWAEATRYMEAAVAAEPERLVHRLDLARVYRDTDRFAEARATYLVAVKATTMDANDDVYRKTAEQELRALR